MARAEQQVAIERETEEKVKSMAEAQEGISQGQLLDDVIELAAQWKPLGIQLNIPIETLDAIREEKDLCQGCLLQIINEWLVKVKGPHTKAMLVEVLKKKAVRLNSLAKRISDDTEIPENFDDNKTEVLRILSSKLSEAGSKYSAIGIQLLNNAARINEIETEMRGKNVEHCLSRTLTEWININDGNAPLPKMLEAIEKKPIGNVRLAMKLKGKWARDGFLATPEETPTNEVTGDGAEDDEEWPDLG